MRPSKLVAIPHLHSICNANIQANTTNALTQRPLLAAYKRSKKLDRGQQTLISKAASSTFDWLKFITANNFDLDIVDCELWREMTTLDTMLDAATLEQHLLLIVEQIKENLKTKELPKTFGVRMDVSPNNTGIWLLCPSDDDHFVSVYAVGDGVPHERVLLGF